MTSEVIEDEQQFYSKAKSYWKQIPATVDGMLGGYGHISSIDINSSRKFLQRFLRVGRCAGLSLGGRGSVPPTKTPRSLREGCWGPWCQDEAILWLSSLAGQPWPLCGLPALGTLPCFPLPILLARTHAPWLCGLRAAPHPFSCGLRGKSQLWPLQECSITHTWLLCPRAVSHARSSSRVWCPAPRETGPSS